MFFKHKCFHDDFYILLRDSLACFPSHVKKNLDHSLKHNLFNWPLHLNEDFIFNIELLPYQGTFEPKVLHSFVFAGKSTVLVHCAQLFPYWATF